MMNQYHDLPLPNEHYTPKWVFDKLGLQFDLDVAAPIDNIGSHVPAFNYFTKNDNGLEQNWYGRVWCNPPFAKATLWANKFLDHNNGVGIFPNSNAYWVDRVWDSDAAIVKLPYKMFYERPDGSSKRIMYTTYLIAVGVENINALRQSGIAKVR
jgi:hypothetical protein